MASRTRAQNPAPAVFVITEQAHLELIQIRDHLRLLAFLTDTGSNASRHDALLRPDALAWWFSRLSRDIDQIVDAAEWSSDAANDD
jgi:hypothetical protein